MKRNKIKINHNENFASIVRDFAYGWKSLKWN